MKKLLALGLSLVMILFLAACGTKPEETTPAPTTAAPTTETPTEAPTTQEPTTEPVPEVKIFSYEEYLAAAKDSEVAVEAYIQFVAYNAEYGNASLFLADEDGAYFVYRMNVSPAEAEQLKEGTKVRVHGFKGEWAGEVEFAEGSADFQVLEGEPYLAPLQDVTGLFGTEDLIKHMNQKIRVSGAVVAPSKDADGNEHSFLYKYNGSGEDGDDLYFNVEIGGEIYTLTVETDECPAGSEVYEAVKALEIGQVVELEGFLYWYEGPQPHVHKITDMAAKNEGVMTYEEFTAAEMDTKVVVEGWIQQTAYVVPEVGNKENGNVCLFLADPDGAYYIWRMKTTPEEAASLTPGVKIRVSGMKTSWSGEVEIEDGTFEILESGAFMAKPLDVTDLLSDSEAVAAFMNRKICMMGMTVVETLDEDKNPQPFLYKHNGSGGEGDDLYFTVAKGDYRYVVLVESDEYGSGSEVYEAVKTMKIGDVLDLTGFLYWYEGPQPHICAIAPSELPSDVTMTYEQFLAAEKDDPVVISAYVQQVAYNAEHSNVCLFLADEDGAYYVYQMPVTEEELAQLQPETKIRVKGTKDIWSGEVEIADATFEVVEGEGGYNPGWTGLKYLDDESLIGIMNQAVILEGGIVVASENADGEQVPFLYKWNGSGQDGDDIYFKVSAFGRIWTFVVESDEFGAGSDVYEEVKALQIGDGLDVYGFLYWYEGPQPHVCRIETEIYAKSSDEVLKYADYAAIDPEQEEKVTVEGYIQLISYNAGEEKYSFFLHDRIGAYYVYGLTLPEEEEAKNELLEKLVLGQYIQVTGYKKAWAGEVEIMDVEDVQFPEAYGEYFEENIDFALLAENDLLEVCLNNPIFLSRAAVVASRDGEGNEVAWMYKWNGTGTDGDDIYFRVMLDGSFYTLVVESDEFGPESEVYEAVKELQIGDVVNLEGFLYWYEGPQPHITFVEKTLVKEEGVMTHAEFIAAEEEVEVTVEGFVQLVSAYNEEKGSCCVFLDDIAGAYYVYNMAVTPEEYAELVPGILIRVSGYKKPFSGEVEIQDAQSYEILYGPDDYLAKPIDIVNIPDVEAAEAFMNRLICVSGATVAASQDAEGNETAFLYKWNGSGQDGDDLYFKVEAYGATYTLVVESDEFAAGSELYEAVKMLQVGDTVDLEGFLYWYEGPQPHVTKITVIQAEEPVEEPTTEEPAEQTSEAPAEEPTTEEPAEQTSEAPAETLAETTAP